MSAATEQTAPTVAEPTEPDGRGVRVGMVGGGQLARMTHQAAICLGVELVILASDPADAAVGVSPNVRFGAPDDLDALRDLARDCDLVTFDHEGIPAECIEALEAEGYTVRPASSAKRVAQDKLHARELLAGLGFPVPDFEPVDTPARVRACGDRWGWPIMLKARRGGYDGRGVRLLEKEQLEPAIIKLRGDWIAERRVAIEREVSQIVVRAPDGESVFYPPIETVQDDGICVETLAPAPLGDDLSGRCAGIAGAIAESIGATGVVAVELFITTEEEVIVNELALRPHNSGHLTIEGCETSQFENHLRAVLGWPLGTTALRAPAVVMRNVIGSDDGVDPAGRIADALAVEGAHPHIYGKRPRPGRKLAHVTALGNSREQATERARRSADLLLADRVEPS